MLIASSIHIDTKYMTAFSKHQYNVDILTFTITEFLNKIKLNSKIIEIVNDIR